MRAGVGALGDNELVAVLLGTGVRAKSALAVAEEVLALCGGAVGLTTVGRDELIRVTGVGPTRAARVLAAVELGRRALSRVGERRMRLETPSDVGRYLLPLFGGYPEERFGVVMLDSRSCLIRAELVSVGTVDASMAHPREIFRRAAAAAATSVVVFHNHPSGDPEPSRADAQLTARLVAAGEIMGIEVVDHLILGSGRWFSFRDRGLML